jgi:sterol desaturase/sphingolipid hydroxylase (fatty acid hydroxylase superfamily)
MIVFNLVEDFVFYWVHRLLHHPVLFKAVHWKHHRFDQIGGHTFSLNGEYSHYVENLFNDLVPMMCGIFAWTVIYSRLALGPEWSFHIFTFWCWITFRQMRTTDSHSGYDLPYHPLRLFRFIYGGARFHMEHHTLKGRRWNFGAFHLWDYLMGTVLDRTSADMREPQF